MASGAGEDGAREPVVPTGTMLRVSTSSSDGTERVAALVAALVRDGDLLLLTGDMGAGKTAFTRGFCRALGVRTPVTSPTFTLANEYEGDAIRINHLDVYRLASLDEVRDLALPEMLDDRAVTLIEWGDTIATALPSDHLEIVFTFGSGDDDRQLVFRPSGRWAARVRALGEALAGESR